MGKCLLITALLVVGLGYVLYVPIPSGFSQPWKIQLFYSSATLMKGLSDMLETFGRGPAYTHIRSIMEFVGKRQVESAGTDDSLEIFDNQFDGIPVRVYAPVGRSASSPGFVFFHGGGWTVGSVDSYDGLVRHLAKETKAVFVAVEYRLAPEHVFPAAFDDCVKATKFFLANAVDFTVDPARIGVGGDSAGGNLAAAVSLKLRDDKFSPEIKLQLLIYPNLQSIDHLTPSYQQNKNDAIVGGSDSVTYWPYYAQGHARDAYAIDNNMHTTPKVKKRMSATYLDVKKLPSKLIPTNFVPQETNYGNETLFKELEHVLMNPYAAPLMAEDLSNLPKAYVFTANTDILRDEGFWYVGRLVEAGVEVHHRHGEIAFHGIFNLFDFIPEAEEYTKEIVTYLKKEL